MNFEVMAGRKRETYLRAEVPAIHVLFLRGKDVDARNTRGHDIFF